MSIAQWITENVLDPTGGWLTGGAVKAGKAVGSIFEKKVVARGLDPDVKEAAYTLIEAWNESYGEATGGEAYLARGIRTAKEQKQYLEEGRSTVEHSKHQDGLAVDIEFRDLETGMPMVPDDTPPDWFYALGEMGEELGFTWGGRWKTLVDMPHFEA